MVAVTGAEFRQQRKQLLMTQLKLASALDISERQIRNLEKNARVIPRVYVLALKQLMTEHNDRKRMGNE